MTHRVAVRAAASRAGALIATPAFAQAPTPPMITVSGEGTVSVPPDLAQIDGGVTTEAKTAREASDANNAAMGKVLLALKSAASRRRISRPRGCRCSRNSAPNRQRPGAYRRRLSRQQPRDDPASRRHQGRGHHRHAGSAGANEIGGISFSVSKPRNCSMTPATQAIADARRKAEIYAKAAGVTLGAPLIFRKMARPAPMPVSQDGAGDAAPAPWRRARRRCGDCQRVLGDQAGALCVTAVPPIASERSGKPIAATWRLRLSCHRQSLRTRATRRQGTSLFS